MELQNNISRELGIHTGQIEAIQKSVEAVKDNVQKSFDTVQEEVHTVKTQLDDLKNQLAEYRGYGKSLVGMAAAVGSILSAILTAFITNLIHRAG